MFSSISACSAGGEVENGRKKDDFGLCFFHSSIFNPKFSLSYFDNSRALLACQYGYVCRMFHLISAVVLTTCFQVVIPTPGWRFHWLPTSSYASERASKFRFYRGMLRSVYGLSHDRWRSYLIRSDEKNASHLHIHIVLGR